MMCDSLKAAVRQGFRDFLMQKLKAGQSSRPALKI